MSEARLHIAIMGLSAMVTVAAVGLGAGTALLLARLTAPDGEPHQRVRIATIVEAATPALQAGVLREVCAADDRASGCL